MLSLCREELQAKLYPLQADMEKLKKLLDVAYRTLQERTEHTADVIVHIDEVESQRDEACTARFAYYLSCSTLSLLHKHLQT